MKRIIEIGRINYQWVDDAEAVPAGWAVLTVEPERDTDGNITSIPITDPPYIRSRTAQDDADDAAAKLARFRQRAVGAFNAAQEESAARDRAIVVEFLEHMNTELAAKLEALQDQHDALLAWLGGQTTLTNRAQLNGFASGPAPMQPTNQQARNAIVNRINNGEADS